MSRIKRSIAFLTAALLLLFCLPMFAVAETIPSVGEEEAASAEAASSEAASKTAVDEETTTAAPADNQDPVDDTSIVATDGEHHTVYGIADQPYTGKEIQPVPTIVYTVKDAGSDVTATNSLEHKKDFTLKYSDNTDVGQAKITIEYLGKYKDVLQKETIFFNIVPKDASSASIAVDSPQKYTGSEVTPALDITLGNTELLEEVDYIVDYSNNVEPGTATAKVTFIGNYKGSAKAEFLIRKYISNIAIIKAIPAQTYTGEEVKPELTITLDGEELIEGEDYDVTYYNNVKASKDNKASAQAKVTYKGIYHGSKTVSFQIVGTNAASSSSITNLSDVVYNGSAQEPKLKISVNGKDLVEGTDYTLKYEDNINVGKATVIVKYTGGYSESEDEKVYFNIKPCVVSGAKIAAIAEQPYAFGRPVMPDALVSATIDGKNINFEEGIDYNFEYTNNRKVGTAGIKAVFIGNYTGSVSSTFTIGAADISDACIAPIPDQKHTGNPITPRVKVYVGKHKLKKDRDYTVAYSNNTAIGQATATVTFKGNYKGTATATFNISETGASSIAQTGEIGAAVIGGIAVVAGVTFFIVRKKKNDTDED